MATALAEPDAKASQIDVQGVDDSTATQLVSFRLGKEEYGVDIMRVQEIILMGHITKMPEVPDFVRGLINLRGSVIPIIDLRRRFDLPVAENNEHTRIIVVNVGDKTIGMVVDAVNEVLRITPEQVEPPPSSIAGIDHAYIRGLVKFKEKLLTLLDIEKILSHEEQAQLVRGTEGRKENM